MHLQQTKRSSRATGGPQYYFHDLEEHVLKYLREKRAIPVALMTPYGPTKSNFMAVSKDYKLEGKRVVPGKVGHDRIQQASAGESIGEAIRKWYGLPPGDFERVKVDIGIQDGRFYVSPLDCKLVEKTKSIPIPRPEYPLSFHQGFQSPLWKRQLTNIRETDAKAFTWALKEIRRVVSAHQSPFEPHVMEPDILRASGPLNIYGVELGPYLGKGYDCKGRFQFLGYPPYEVPVEIKKHSSRFKYQQQKYGREELSRAVILCVHHDLVNPPPYIDVIELRTIAESVERVI